MKQLIFLLILFFGGLPLIPQAQTQPQIKLFGDKTKSFIRYSMNHPLHSWTGESSDFTSVVLVDEAKTVISQVAVSAKISTFDSKNANRDSHTMEVTEALKYPSVTFTSKSIRPQGPNAFLVSGTLTFHGVNKDISFEVKQKNSGKLLEVEGAFIVKMTEFNISRPSMMGMAAEDDIKIEFKVVF